MIRRACGLLVACLALAGPAAAQIVATSPASLDPDQRELTPDEMAVVDAAIRFWERTHTQLGPITIEVSFDSGIGGLANTNAFTIDGSGQPVFTRIRFRDQDPGLFWVDPTPGDAAPGEVPVGFFDFLTIAQHEIGHAIGFTVGYPKFSAHVGAPFPPDNLRPFDCAASPPATATLTATTQGTHTAPAVHPNDLMNPTIGGARRRLVSPVDAHALACAFSYGLAPPIPAVSHRGLVALVLLFLAASLLVFRKL